jgi:hypothetical protein
VSAHEKPGKSDEWYTPQYIFSALGETFDLDVAAPKRHENLGNFPSRWYARTFISADSLSVVWGGFIWMNPPFGKRNGLEPWLEKFCAHGNGIALTPDRTSAPWWQAMAKHEAISRVLFIAPKVRFLKPDGTTGRSSPGTGTCLWAAGDRAARALDRASSLGVVLRA